MLAFWVPWALADGCIRFPGASLVAGAVVLSAGLACVNHSGAHVVARGVWWSQLAFGTLASVSYWGGARELGLPWGAGGALLLAGSAGLGAGGAVRGSFRPVPSPSAACCSPHLILTIAEVQAMGVVAWFLLVSAPGGRYEPGAACLACALSLALAAVDLYRLRLWGVFAHLAATAALAAWALRAALAGAEGVPVAWASGLVVQSLLPLPMLAAIARRRPIAASPPSPVWPRLFYGPVLALMALSAANVLRG